MEALHKTGLPGEAAKRDQIVMFLYSSLKFWRI